MCATCGCSDATGVRIVDPETGESVLLPTDPAEDHEHQHVDDHGRTYTHTHAPTAEATGEHA